MSVAPCSEKFNIVSNNHGSTQRCDFCISVFKTNFTDHQPPDTIHGFSIVKTMVLEIRFWSVKCTSVTVRINFEHFHSFPSSNCDDQTSYMEINLFKMLLKIFSTTYTYSNCIVYRLFYCWKTVTICSKISKTRMNLWMVYTSNMRSSGNYERREECECIVHRWPKSWEICGCTRSL